MSDNNKDLSPYNIVGGTLYLIAKNVVVSISASLFFVLIARFILNVSDIGLIVGLQALMTIIVLLATLGLPGAAIRFVSSYLGTEKDDMAKGITKLIFEIGLISSATLSFGLYISAPYIATVLFHDINYSHLIQIASVDSFLLVMINFSNSLLYALQRFRIIATVSIVNSLIRFAASFALLVGMGMGLDGIVLGWIIADLVALAIYMYSVIPPIRRVHIPIQEMRPLLNYAIPVYGSAVMTYLAINIDNYLLLSLSGIFAAGIYGPAVLIGSVLLMTQSAVGEALFPYFSRIYGKSGLKSLSDSSIPASRYVFLIYIPFGIAILACAPQLIMLTFGERYSESIYPAMIVILAITLTSIGIVFNFVLLSAGHTHLFLKSTAMGLSAQLAISFLTIPFMGALGAAFSRFSSYAIMFVYNTYKLKQIAGLHYDHNALQKGLVGSVIMALVIFTMNLYLSDPYYLALNLPMGFLSYLLFLRFTRAMNVQDIEIMNSFMPGRLRSLMPIISKILIN